MTPTQLAQAECANCSICPACSVEERRCAYFEECVLPLAESPNLDSDTRMEYGKAANKYRGLHKMTRRFAKYRKCTCGTEIGSRVRYCPTCARNIRRERSRQRQIKHRSLAQVQ